MCGEGENKRIKADFTVYEYLYTCSVLFAIEIELRKKNHGIIIIHYYYFFKVVFYIIFTRR